jgi:gamma-glutamyltranspeptidase/glutathione hydrolase
MSGTIMATNGAVASEHPLATQTGVDVLRRGGNAFDAALAMSAVLPVVKPHRNHLGGDAFVLVWPAAEGAVTAICAGGKAPAAATPELYASGIPQRGGLACAIPGMVDAWHEFHTRWCTWPLADLLAPAIGFARDGFPVSHELARTFAAAQSLFGRHPGLARAFFPGGRVPEQGEVLCQPHLADTLEAIADGGRAAFYEGALGERIARAVCDAGGCMTADDLAAHRADVVKPLSSTYRGCAVYETPPQSQGVILLEELAIIEGFDVAGMGHLSADAIHVMVEAKKLAFEDRLRFAGDPSIVDFDPARLYGAAWAGERRNAIDRQRAAADTTAAATSDTTSFVVVDGAGNACSFIQSIFAHFGSAVAVDGAGIILNNRMTGFSLDPQSPNVLAPGKRTMHTLNTYLVFRDGQPYIVGNTPGADFQVQTNLQVITGVIDYGLDAQAALDAPRWGHANGELMLEPGISAEAAEELARRGHHTRRVERATNPMGRAQCIVIDPATGALAAGSDSRGEGSAGGG